MQDQSKNLKLKPKIIKSNPFNRSLESGQCAKIDAFRQIVSRINNSFRKKI